jgi:O-antigen/teichoic acid export membrane protein
MASTWLLLLLLVTTNAALIPLLGMVGAAYGTFFSLLAVNALNAFQVRRRYGLPGVDPLAFSVAAATILGILAQAMDTSIAALALLLAATGIALVRAVQLSLRSPPAVGMK